MKSQYIDRLLIDYFNGLHILPYIIEDDQQAGIMVRYTHRTHGPNGGSCESEQRIMITIEGICTALQQHVKPSLQSPVANDRGADHRDTPEDAQPNVDQAT